MKHLSRAITTLGLLAFLAYLASLGEGGIAASCIMGLFIGLPAILVIWTNP